MIIASITALPRLVCECKKAFWRTKNASLFLTVVAGEREGGGGVAVKTAVNILYIPPYSGSGILNPGLKEPECTGTTLMKHDHKIEGHMSITRHHVEHL